MNRPARRMPRGRQTIRKSGSVSDLLGPTSRLIKLWTAESKPNTIMAELEHAYFAALEAVDRIEERSRTNATGGKLTPEGAKADTLQFALSDLMPGLLPRPPNYQQG
jgi:hypothetical protein